MPALDGIRGLAILLVAVWHLVVSRLRPEPGSAVELLSQVLSFTWAGVDLFFVLSGFLIGGILLDKFHCRNFLSVFYIRRTCRIWPLYLVMLGWYCLWVYLQPTDPARWVELLIDGTKPPWWSYLVFVQNVYFAVAGEMGPLLLDVTWSLAVEEQFYLLLPLAFLLVGERRVRYLPLVLIASAIAIRWAVSGTEIGWWASYLLLPTRWDSLGFGLLAAVIVRQPSLWRLARRYSSELIWLAVIAAVYCIGTHTFRNRYGQPWGIQLFGYSVIAAGAAAIILHVVVDAESMVTRVFSLRWLRWLGQISFGLYLFHKPVLWITHGLVLGQRPFLTSGRDLAVTLLSFAIALFLSWCSWTLWESRWQALGHRYRYR